MEVVFKKLFGRKDSPTKEGKSSSSAKVDGVQWVKRFVLELSNMEGTPHYNLTHQLTIGSEVGNIVIADPSVSPRHCTFILQEEVVSVLDHGSVSGTFVNGQNITPGRYIILEESDTVMVGDLEVKIQTKNESVVQEVEEEEVVEEEEIEEEIEEEVEDEEVDEEEVKNIRKGPYVKKSDRGKKKKSQTRNSPYATNSLIRVIAVVCDILISYCLFVVFSPFDEFQSFVNDVPVMLSNLFEINWSGLWTVLNEEYSFIGEVLKDLYSFFSVTFNIGPLILLFVMVRLVSTLLFGVTISEAMLGVKSHGNLIWKRIGGVFRVIIGIVTGPFIVFDVPAIISRRTFKEFMTFTHTYLSSKFITILGVLFYVPLIIAVSLISPLLQGLELPEPIAVNSNLSKRVKVAAAPEAPVVEKTKDLSKFINVELEYDPKKMSIIPSFKFRGEKNKLNYRPALIVYEKELQRSVELELFKSFDLKELLSIGFKGDIFLKEKYPNIDKFLYSQGVGGAAFKKELDAKAVLQFAGEVVAFTKMALELQASNALDIMQTETPLLKGPMDYRSSFLALIEYKGFDTIDFIKLGNGYFLRISYVRQNPFDLLIPLIPGEGRIFKLEFEGRENLAILRNKFYKYSFEDSNWFPEKEILVIGETLQPLQVLDLFSKVDEKGELKIRSVQALALYGYYFEKSAAVLKSDDSVELEIWKKSVETVASIVGKMKNDAAIEGEDQYEKLTQNFKDLKDALESKNKIFFGIEASVI
jgi:hypothetical protein